MRVPAISIISIAHPVRNTTICKKRVLKLSIDKIHTHICSNNDRYEKYIKIYWVLDNVI